MRGIAELQSRRPLALEGGRIRRAGAGRPRAVTAQPALEGELESILEETTAGDPRRGSRAALFDVAPRRQGSVPVAEVGERSPPWLLLDGIHPSCSTTAVNSFAILASV
jgi:hypothetical protein